MNTRSILTRHINRSIVALAAAGSLAMSLSACAPLIIGGAVVGGSMVAVDRRTSGAQLEDEGIELRAGARLGDALGDRAHINVTSYNRQVLLTGEVASDKDKQTAEAIVGKVENVRAVVNELAVLGASSLSQRSNDSLVTGKVKASLVDARDISAHAFKVVTERGVVYLMGRVTQREATRATEVVRTVSGVQRVVRVLEIITDQELQSLQSAPAK